MDKASEGTQHELLGAFEHLVARGLETIDAHARAALLHDEAAALLDRAASAQQNRDRRAELLVQAAHKREYAAAARTRGRAAHARLAADGRGGGARSATF